MDRRHDLNTSKKPVWKNSLNPPFVLDTLNGSALLHDASLLIKALDMPILNGAVVVVTLVLLLCLVRRPVVEAAGVLAGSGLCFAGICCAASIVAGSMYQGLEKMFNMQNLRMKMLNSGRCVACSENWSLPLAIHMWVYIWREKEVSKCSICKIVVEHDNSQVSKIENAE